MLTTLAAALAWSVTATSPLQPPLPGLEPVSISTAWSIDEARPGDARVLAVVLDIAPTYHVNPSPEQLGESDLIPTTIEVDVGSAPLTLGPIQWPTPHDVPFLDSTTPAFEGRATAYVPVVVTADASLGDHELRVTVDYQTCNDRTCLLPQSVTLEPVVRVVDPAAFAGGTPDDELFAAFDRATFTRMLDGSTTPAEVEFDAFGFAFALDASSTLGFALLLLVAALGGLLLNLTPCVLPVIPLKIMSLSQSAGSRRRCLALGVSMTAGVIGFWVGLGALIAAVSGFTATNQLFQWPPFTIGVGVIIAVMAAGMCGLFWVRLPAAVYRFQPKHDSHVGSFAFGVMTAVLSTPCTAPFMGAAAAWAATRTQGTTLVVFAAIGAGMALPYLVLAATPRLLSRVPRDGQASVLVKQVMGLLMLAAAGYFIGVGLTGQLVAPPDPPSRLYWWPVAAAVMTAGGWLAIRAWRITPRLAPRLTYGAIGLLLLVGAPLAAASLSSKGPITWTHYTDERLDAALGQGRAVVIEFTAEWCLNCKAMEQGVLHQPDVADLLNGSTVTPIKVDLTGNNDAGNELLRRFGRVAIPLLVVLAPDGAEVFQSDFYSVEQVQAAVRDALTRTAAAAGSPSRR